MIVVRGVPERLMRKVQSVYPDAVIDKGVVLDPCVVKINDDKTLIEFVKLVQVILNSDGVKISYNTRDKYEKWLVKLIHFTLGREFKSANKSFFGWVVSEYYDDVVYALFGNACPLFVGGFSGKIKRFFPLAIVPWEEGGIVDVETFLKEYVYKKYSKFVKPGKVYKVRRGNVVLVILSINTGIKRVFLNIDYGDCAFVYTLYRFRKGKKKGVKLVVREGVQHPTIHERLKGVKKGQDTLIFPDNCKLYNEYKLYKFGVIYFRKAGFLVVYHLNSQGTKFGSFSYYVITDVGDSNVKPVGNFLVSGANLRDALVFIRGSCDDLVLFNDKNSPGFLFSFEVRCNLNSKRVFEWLPVNSVIVV